MPFDKDLALGRALRRRYLPPILTAPFPNPKEYTLTADFMSGPGVDFDINKTDDAHHWIQAQNYMCPARPLGKTVFDSEQPPYNPGSGLGAWENCSVNGGVPGTFFQPDSDTAIQGTCFKLEANGNVGATAGIRTTVPTVPTARFSMMLVQRVNKGYPWIPEISPYPEDAAYVILTNNEGASMVTRYYKQKGEILCGDINDPVDTSVKWRLFAGHVDDFFWECWPELKKVSAGVYDVTVRAGTTLVGQWRGDVPFNYNGLGNNKLQFHITNGILNWRKFDLRTFNIGESQNAANCSIVSMPLSTGGPQLSSFQIAVHLGETSGDLKLGTVGSRLNQDFELYGSATNGDQWTKVNAEVIAEVGWDVIDPTKKAYVIGGTANFANTGNAMRWHVRFSNEYFGTLQGVQMLGFA